MFQISLLALLATKVFASPLPNSDSTQVPRAASSYILACEAADNCETYTDPSGRLSIRFKSGMEPGTDDYNTRVASSHTKRQSGYPQTQITVGDTTILWGCDTDPVATLGNLASVCATSGQCIENEPYSETVQYVSDTVTAQTPETLTIAATGTYPTWIRDGLVQGVQAAMSAQGVIDTTSVNYLVTTGPINKNGMQTTGASCNVASAPDFIGLGVYSAPNVLEATISVDMSITTPVSGFCSLAPAAALTGAMVGVFGPAGAALGGIFGTVSAVCGL